MTKDTTMTIAQSPRKMGSRITSMKSPLLTASKNAVVTGSILPHSVGSSGFAIRMSSPFYSALGADSDPPASGTQDTTGDPSFGSAR